jgi:hypothetical protein
MIATEHFSAIAADFGRLKGIRCGEFLKQATLTTRTLME